MALPVLTPNSPSAGFIAWSSFSIRYGTVSVTIPAGNTSSTYVYWLWNGGAPAAALQTSNVLPTLTADDLLIFVNRNGIPINVTNTNVIEGSLIATDSIIGTSISGNTITGDKMQADTLTAREIQTNAITANELSVSGFGGLQAVNGEMNDVDPVTFVPAGWVAGFERSGTAPTYGAETAAPLSGSTSVKITLAANSTEGLASTATACKPGDMISFGVACRASVVGAPITIRAYFGNSPTFTRAQTIAGTPDAPSNVVVYDVTAGGLVVRSNQPTPLAGAGIAAAVEGWPAPVTTSLFVVGQVKVPAGATFVRFVLASGLVSSPAHTMVWDSLEYAPMVTSVKIANGVVTADKLALGIRGNNLIADPSFEDAQPLASPSPMMTGNNPAGWNADSIASGGAVELRRMRGRSGAWSATCTVGATAGTSSMRSNVLPVAQGQTYKVSYYAIETTAAGSIVAELYGGADAVSPMTLQTLAPDAEVPPTLSIANPEPYDPSLYTAYTYDYVVPAGVNFIQLRLGNNGANSSVIFDDVAVVLKGVTSSEITAAGIRLFDEEGLEVGAFVSNRPNYFSVSRGGAIVAAISEDGSVSGSSGSFTGDTTLTNDLGDVPGALTVGGEDYADRMAALPQGIIAQVLRNSVTINKIQTEYGIYEISFLALPGRHYRVAFWGGRAKGNVNTTSVTIRVRRTSDGTTPKITSFVTREWDTDLSGISGGSNLPYVQANGLYVPAGGQPTLIRNLYTLAAWNGGSTGYVDLMANGVYPMEAIVEDLGMDVPDTWVANSGGGVLYTGGSDAGGGGNPTTTKKTYTSTWAANGSQTRRGVSGYGNYTVNTSAPSGYNLAGYYSSSNGNQFTYLGFTGSNSTGGETGKSIGTALSGATVSKVELYVQNATFYGSSGGSQRFSMTTLTSIPSSGSASSTQGTGYTANQSFSTGQGKWITLPTDAATRLLAGARVAIIGPGSSNANSYYSKWYDHVGSGTPALRITYTK